MYHIPLNDAGVAAVQAWINNPAQNYGIIVKDYAVNDGLQVSSSEAAAAALRPKLLINYESATPPAQQLALASFAGLGNLAPSVSAGLDLTVQLGQTLTLSGMVSDDGQPDSLALLNVLWSKVSGPGAVTFSDDTSAGSTVQFNSAGTYVLRLSASDGDLEASDELTVTVTEPERDPVVVAKKKRRWGAGRRRP
jgi:hypothetical protein